MIRGSVLTTEKPSAVMPKRSARATSVVAEFPPRSVTRRLVFTTCATWSGPTPTHGSGGSPFVDGPEASARPANPGNDAGGLVVTVASTGGGGVTSRGLRGLEVVVLGIA